jgi:hypothetical protein
VISRYRRAERAVSWTLASIVTAAFLASVAALSLWAGVAVAAVLAVALRVPVFRRRGSVRLRTDAPPEDVAREFASPTPPILAFQWGVADEVRETDDADGRRFGATATYAFSALFGLKTIDLDLSARVTSGEALVGDGGNDTTPGTDGEPAATVEIEGTTGDARWASYAVAVREAADGGSVVDVELRPTRRFDLRRLPQGWVGERYYADALAAQGYAVVERSVSMTR